VAIFTESLEVAANEFPSSYKDGILDILCPS
jgi:hypothetical protein